MLTPTLVIRLILDFGNSMLLGLLQRSFTLLLSPPLLGSRAKKLAPCCLVSLVRMDGLIGCRCCILGSVTPMVASTGGDQWPHPLAASNGHIQLWHTMVASNGRIQWSQSMVGRPPPSNICHQGNAVIFEAPRTQPVSSATIPPAII